MAKRPLTYSLCFALGLVLSGPVAQAEDADSAVPDLVGTWSASGVACYHLEDHTTGIVVEIRITEQDGRFFRGIKAWAHEGKAVMDAGGQLMNAASEPVMGVVAQDGKTLHVVEHADSGHHFIRLVNSETMEVVYAESGSAAAVCEWIATRQ